MSDASNDNQAGLDDIDIDAILNASIGSTGRPSVPSADEKLPSLIEEDIIDVKAFLKEVAEKEAAEKSVASPEKSMETIDTDILFNELQIENLVEEQPPAEKKPSILDDTPKPITTTNAEITVTSAPSLVTTPPSLESSKLAPGTKKKPLPAAPKGNQAGLDEIDIDAILNASIGSTGRPSVPSANEKLPSLLEEDVIDVEEFLKEMAEKEAAENSLASSDAAMETIDTDSLFDESQIDALIAEEQAALVHADPDPLMTNIVSLEPVLAVVEAEHNDEELPPRLVLSTLLSQEAIAIEVGNTPIPELPGSLPFTATRHFSTYPKRHLSYLQKRGIFYAVSILIWLSITLYSSHKIYQRYVAHKNPAKLNHSKPILKKTSLKKPPLPVAPLPLPVTQHPTKPAPIVPKQEAVSTPQDLDQKDGIENFDPVQCNLDMDSLNIREELEKCLRAAKVMNQ